MEIQKPTRDIGTKQLYLKRTMTFIIRAYKEASNENHEILNNKNNIYSHNFGEDQQIIGLTLFNTVLWACKNWAKTISQKSWRGYRAPLAFTTELYLKANLIDKDTSNKINLILAKTKGIHPSQVEELRTSAKKQKHLTIKDLKLIDNELKISTSYWGTGTRLWLRAGILTGLRPIEWRKASLVKNDDDDFYTLNVFNAKNTNERGNGETRNLNLAHLTKDDISIIKNHLLVVDKFNKNKKDWTMFHQSCSNLLRNKNKKLFPNRKKHPTLYSARHQFSANVKASGCKPEEIAALMGHATDLTAQMTYGKKVNGTRGLKPNIEKSEIDSVRRNKKTNKGFSFENRTGNKVVNKNNNNANK